MRRVILTFILWMAIVFTLFWASAPYLFSTKLADALKVPVSANRLTVSSKKVNISQLKITNPPGSVIPRAFFAEKFQIHTPFLNYLKKKIVIDEITLDGIYLSIEFEKAGSTNGNWTILMNNLKKATEDRTKNREVLIKKVTLTNISVDLVFDQQTGKVQTLPPIPLLKLTNVSSEKGIPLDQIMNSVLGSMLHEVFQEYALKTILPFF